MKEEQTLQMSDKQKEQLANNIKNLRGNMPQDKFAKIMGVTRNSVVSYENQKTTPGSMELYRLHEHFGVSYSYLYGETDDLSSSIELKDYKSLGLSDEFIDYIFKARSVLDNENSAKYMELRQSYATLQLINNLFKKDNQKMLSYMNSIVFNNLISNHLKNQRNMMGSKMMRGANFYMLMNELDDFLCNNELKLYDLKTKVDLEYLIKHASDRHSAMQSSSMRNNKDSK